MLYYLALKLQNYSSFAKIFSYLSVRILAASVTSLGLFFVFGRRCIHFAKVAFASKVRPFTPESHQVKNNTPTMGGIFILGAVLISVLCWTNLAKSEIWLSLLVLLGFGGIGLADDLCKIWYKKGIAARLKFLLQIGVATIVVTSWVYLSAPKPLLHIPFFALEPIHLGVFFIPWLVFIIVAMSNAVNLTDGLDGLAIGTIIPNFVLFLVLSYVAGNSLLAYYLNVPYLGATQMPVIIGALVGASLGFLWFNTYPAQIFMGDVGSLALGAILAWLAIVVRQELLLPIAGSIFLLEVLSVIGQCAWFKYFGKRILKMAPLHHHFELLGYAEPTIVTRFVIISIIASGFALVLILF